MYITHKLQVRPNIPLNRMYVDVICGLKCLETQFDARTHSGGRRILRFVGPPL